VLWAQTQLSLYGLYGNVTKKKKMLWTKTKLPRLNTLCKQSKKSVQRDSTHFLIQMTFNKLPWKLMLLGRPLLVTEY
jgi:hypothetical protein